VAGILIVEPSGLGRSTRCRYEYHAHIGFKEAVPQLCVVVCTGPVKSGPVTRERAKYVDGDPPSGMQEPSHHIREHSVYQDRRSSSIISSIRQLHGWPLATSVPPAYVRRGPDAFGFDKNVGIDNAHQPDAGPRPARA
jgi:hypothetical protein